MSLVLVLTVASLALAEEGYRYNPPSASLNLPINQPAKFFHNGLHHGSVNHAKGIGGVAAAPTASPITNNGYVKTGYVQSFTTVPTVTFNNNYAPVSNSIKTSHSHNFLPVTNSHGYSHASSLIGSSSNIGYPQNSISSASASFNTGHQTSALSATHLHSGHRLTLSPTISNNLNSGQAISSSVTTNFNSGYRYSTPSANAGLTHSYVNTPVVSTNSNLNTGYSQTLPSIGSNHLSNEYSSSSSSVNTGYSQPLPHAASANFGNNYAPTSSAGNINDWQPVTSSVSSNFNNGYSQVTTSSVSGNQHSDYTVTPYSSTSNLNNGYIQTPVTGTGGNLNSGYSQAFSQSATSAGSINRYSSISLPSATSYHNTGHAHSLTSVSSSATGSNSALAQSSITSEPILNTEHSQSAGNLNSGYSQSAIATASASVNSGNSQISAGAQLNTGYGPPLLSQTSSSLSNGYAQATTVSFNDNQNPAADASLNSGNSQISAGAQLNTGYGPPLLSQASSSLSNGYAQASTVSFNDNQNPAADASLNSGNSQISAGAQLNTGYGPPLLSQASSSLSNGYAQASTVSFNDNQNPAADTSLNGGNIQTAGISNGFLQTSNFNGNSGSVTVSSSSGIASGAAVAPVVVKHIYFHAPPPDVEEELKAIPPPPPPKKNYKILFIKLPAQETESNVARLQQLARLRNEAAVEHKTLIYVLVKNPEPPQPAIIPKRTPSEHEVFFVKYNGNPLDLAAEVNDELDKSGTVKSIVPLEPGLVNGRT